MATNEMTIETIQASQGSTPVAETQSLRRRVLGLAAPVIGENLLQTLLGIVDTILVAGLGAAALAGVGAALQVVFVLTAALTALSVGASVLVAQAFGAGDKAAAGRVARQALIWSVVVSVPIALAGFPVSPLIIGLFGMEADVAHIAVQYLHVTLGTIVTMIVLQIGGGVLRGVGDGRTPMLVTALANVLNAALAYALIYGHLGLPALGAVGSAWGTFLSRLVAVVLLVGVLIRGRNGVRIGGHASWRPQWHTARQVLHIGLPAALEEMILITAFAALTPLVATAGTIALAAHRVAMNILSLSFLPGIGFAIAATALVGQSIGARRPDEARAIAAIALRWAAIWMSVLGVIFLISAPQLMRLFSDDPAMIASGAAAIRIVAIAQPLWAASLVYAGALRGTGNTRLPLLISSVSMWSAVGIAYLLVTWVQPSLASVWLPIVLLSPFEVAGFWWAWRSLMASPAYRTTDNSTDDTQVRHPLATYHTTEQEHALPRLRVQASAHASGD